MIFYLHYILLTSGLSGTSVLLGVYLQQYCDASQGEIGTLLMSFPFIGMVFRPLFCSLADRNQTHKHYLVLALALTMIGYSPYVIIPFLTDFYTHHPRMSWYILFFAGQVGCSGLCVAWSLGDSLAVNMSHRKGTPYCRMRLMGTVSWGVSGYLIGLVNEVSFLPKYLPAFLTMEISILLEIILILLWNDDDFKMGDPETAANNQQLDCNKLNHQNQSDCPRELTGVDYVKTSALDSISLASDVVDAKSKMHIRSKILARNCSQESRAVSHLSMDGSTISGGQKVKKDLQRTLLMMIASEDGRLVKYLILYTMAGFILSPLKFLFISISEHCVTAGCNFSELAGSMLISQASIETACFLLLPYILKRISKVTALSCGFVIMAMRYIFYSMFYYTSGISPYWSVIGEWAHGIYYAIFCTIMADVALMFSNESRMFIPELNKLGLLNSDDLDQEKNINFALRATMQALFSGFMDGLGAGTGSLLCGVIADSFSYIFLWKVFVAIIASTLLIYLLFELTRSKWSDSYRPSADSKAFQILAMSKAQPSVLDKVCKSPESARRAESNDNQIATIA